MILRVASVLSFLLILASPCPASLLPFTIAENGHERAWAIDPATLEMEAHLANDKWMLIMGIADAPRETPRVEGTGPWHWRIESQGLDVTMTQLDGGGIEIELVSDRPQELSWPVFRLLTEVDDELLWPLGEGVILPASDLGRWRGPVLEEPLNVGESMSLPLIGVRRGGATFSWMTNAPLRETISLQSYGSENWTIVTHDFSAKSPERRVKHRFFVDASLDPLAPALRYRNWLEETGELVTLEEKAERVPAVELLKGAAHVYLWGDTPLSRHDAPRHRWKDLASALMKENAAAVFLRGYFDAEQLEAVAECATLPVPYDYLKDQVAAALSKAILDPAFRDAPIWVYANVEGEGAELWRRHRSLEPWESRLLNSYLLASLFPDVFYPPRTWGNGVSLPMLNELSSAELDRLKLCTEGEESLSLRPWVAEDAVNRGWLIGPYDSYHSVHTTADAGTDRTWPTAQMTQELFDEATVTAADGSYLSGFRGIGRKLNPVAGRAYMEERVRRNMERTRSNYYFMDCDATGEVHDDFTPEHPLSREEDAAARRERLEWIANEFGVVVGSEGGNAPWVRSVHVAEGVFGPFFGWNAPEMKDPKSQYYRGRYYPPDGPEVNFKPVPLLDRFRRLHYDPTHQVPLHAAVFHDAVVATYHWSNAHFKYQGIRPQVALREVLYLSPPLYHFNRDEFRKREAAVKEHYAVWSPLHRAYGFARMNSFEFLTADRTVQEARYEGGCRIRVNFGETPFGEGAEALPPLTATILAPGVWEKERIYTPTR